MLCRSLIRKALDDAAEILQDDLTVDDAPRVEIDQDTQGKPGSPPVAETILQKIRECDAFVADLSFTGCREGKSGSPVPNPNVLIEYGYALHALGGKRVIAVFNEEFGNCKDLPFDLQHRRWPMTYRASCDESDEHAQAARRTERRKLSEKLAKSIKSIVQEEGKREEDSGLLDTGPLVEEFPLAGGIYLGDPGKQYWFPKKGAMILLSLRSGQGNQGLTNRAVMRIAHQSLRPLASRFLSGSSPARVSNGAAVAKHPGSSSTIVRSASILLRDGSLYGIDCSHIGRPKRMRVSDPYVPVGAVEKILTDGLYNFQDVAKQQLDLALPLEVGVVLEGIKDHYLGVDQSRFFDGNQGPILVERLEHRFQIEDYGADPAELLKPFFEMIYDEAGLERP